MEILQPMLHWEGQTVSRRGAAALAAWGLAGHSLPLELFWVRGHDADAKFSAARSAGVSSITKGIRPNE